MSKIPTKAMPGDAEVDVIVGNQAVGGAAATLLANGMDVNKLRANATTLRDHEWEELDRAVVGIARGQYSVINDLRSRGLEHTINGLSRTMFTWDTLNDLGDAEISMRPGDHTKQEGFQYVRNFVPLPVIHKDFSIDSRELAVSRAANDGLDVTGAEVATVKVLEKAEEVMMAGFGSYQFASQVLYGLYDHTNINTVTLSDFGNWDASGVTGEDILDCVNAMIQAAINDNFAGPWGLYIPQAYASTINRDFKAYGTATIAQRILDLAGPGANNKAIEYIKVHSKLGSNHLLLVPLNPTQVKIIVGLDVTNVPWDSPGGWTLHHKVMCILIPWVRADQTGRCGLVRCQ